MNMTNLDHFVLESNLPGLSAGLILDNEVQEEYIGKMGTILPYNQRIVQADLIYDIASLTKVVGTTTRILQFLQNGELKLTTQVANILPEYGNLTITIADLLLHKSGLPADLTDKRKLNLTVLNQFYRYVNPIKNAPMCYSDLGFILLGIIIEKIDATDLETSFKNNIFVPFEMTNTGYHLDIDKERYVPTEITLERGTIVGEVHDSKAYYLKKTIGSAGLFSSLNDLIHFSKILLSNQLPNQKQLFTENIYHDLKNYTLNQRTYGWGRMFGDGIIYHTGFTGPSIGLDLINKNGLILLTNRVHPNRNNQTYLHTRDALYRHFFALSEQRRA